MDFVATCNVNRALLSRAATSPARIHGFFDDRQPSAAHFQRRIAAIGGDVLDL
jgi:hypothetical protein